LPAATAAGTPGRPDTAAAPSGDAAMPRRPQPGERPPSRRGDRPGSGEARAVRPEVPVVTLGASV